MKTTLDLPADICRQAKVHAAPHPTTLGNRFIRTLKMMLHEPLARPKQTQHKKTDLPDCPYGCGKTLA
ncbi:MAG: hypothetical protein NTW21_27375 [Verrucomicrobia bacterium]|nr:hypothetical protein [Verrucomicrobiota bacterium]